MADGPSFRQGLEHFAQSLTANFASSTPAQPEDQLKAPLQALLKSGAILANRRVVVRTEAQVKALGGRPDLAVDIDGLLAGYIELKAPGLGARPQNFRDKHSKAQWKKFQALPNLIYTDGNEWTLFRSGKQISRVQFQGDVTQDSIKAFSDDDADKLARLLQDFMLWEPSIPSEPRALAELLAPLCRMVRDDVTTALQDSGSALSQLANDWRDTLFPDADDAQFADAYAQTLTYSLLLARLSNPQQTPQDLEPDQAARILDSGHGLLADTLRILGNRGVREDLGVGLDVLIRAINRIDAETLVDEGDEPWLYFYENFLAAYDPKLRKDYGVYYTPAQVIQAQVRLVSELLETHFGKSLSFADEKVVVLDPAAGTGAYPLKILQYALDHVSSYYGSGIRSQYASKLANNLHAFEFLVGPYAVAHLRITQKILAEAGSLPEDGVHVYLTDTLESPETRSLEQHGFMYRRLTEEHRRARRVKNDLRVLVCIGNPPYKREKRDENEVERGVQPKGGWVRFGEQNLNDETRGILTDFVQPALDAGHGGHIKNLYNDYVYFWRWALWKVFEQTEQAGIVCFITAASYLRGPGFVGMREHMRRVLDELWIIDLEGDSLGARKTDNVFNIRTPVAIAIGIRYARPEPNTPAKAHYARIEGERESKLTQLAEVEHFSDLTWRDCYEDWQAPFLPVGEGNYYAWPLLTDLFPWQHSGSQVKRTWPIATKKEVLQKRWHALLRAPQKERAKLFRETRDRKVTKDYPSLDNSERLVPIAELDTDAKSPPIVRYGYKSFDREWLLLDNRLGDYLKIVLWQTLGNEQIYLTSLLTEVLGLGPAAVVSAHVPDLHHFRGSFGGKHVVPLWRDAEATEPNITAGVLSVLEKTYGKAVSPEDFFAYAYGLLASPDYVERFSEELTLPGPRLPITKDVALFREVAALGRTLIGWHTYGERMGGSIPRGAARNTVAVPTDPEHYPNEYRYDPQTKTLHVGEGEFCPVEPDVWELSVSGLDVVKSWLGYRMREPAGRKSSPLDDIRPEQWTAELTKELLELLWVLEKTIELQPQLSEKLDAVVSSPTLSESELPTPSEAEKHAPERDTQGMQGSLF